MKSDGTYYDGDPPSVIGDYIQLGFLMDSLFAVSACPYVLGGLRMGNQIQ